MAKIIANMALSMFGGPNGLILYILHQVYGVKLGDAKYAKISPILAEVEPIIEAATAKN